MGKRKLRFDVRKNNERKKLCNSNFRSTPSICMPVNSSPLPITNVQGLYRASYDKLPPGWTSTCVTSATNEDTLALYKLQLQQPPLAPVSITYMVTVLPNWTWSACVQNKIVDTRGCSRLNSFAETINNVSELIQLLSAIDGSKHCAGNPDEKFNDLVASHKGIFKNQQGYHYLYIVIIYSCVL